MKFAGMYETEQAVDRGKEMVDQATMQLPSELRHKVQTVFAEMIANAWYASVQADAEKISVMISVGRDTITLMVKDHAKGFSPETWLMAEEPTEPWNITGRGIFIMRRLCNHLVIKSSAEGTMVLASWLV